MIVSYLLLVYHFFNFINESRHDITPGINNIVFKTSHSHPALNIGMVPALLPYVTVF